MRAGGVVGAVIRKLLGHRHIEGLAAARAITRLYGACRFQWKPSRCSDLMASSVLTKSSTGVKGTTGKKRCVSQVRIELASTAPSQSME
jgi:hypothetical protein